MKSASVSSHRWMIGAVIWTYAASVLSQPAYAWSAQGHEYIGNLGWEVLNPRARDQVAALLGPNVTLGEAAVWSDCLRDVTGSATTQFRFHTSQYTPRVCRENFDDDGVEEGQLTDYAARNWTNCEYAGSRTKCNLAFHFANVNVHNRTAYRLGYFGTGPQDVVQAVKAAIAVLRCPDGHTCAVPAPFVIGNKREALFMLAHFVGDLHQPLHVGAVYLDANGRKTGDHGRMTTGGNWLLFRSGGDNLHGDWDTILGSLGRSPSSDAIADACRIAPRPNPVFERPETWASQSVRLARTAYAGMTFSPDPGHQNKWIIHLADAADYRRDRQAVQARQIVTAGARFGAVLNAVWPSQVRAAACAGVIASKQLADRRTEVSAFHPFMSLSTQSRH